MLRVVAMSRQERASPSLLFPIYGSSFFSCRDEAESISWGEGRMGGLYHVRNSNNYGWGWGSKKTRARLVQET